MVDAASRLLFIAQDGDAFQARIPPSGSEAASTVVSEYHAREALLELLDLAPEWARSTVVDAPARRFVTELCEPADLASLLSDCVDELQAPSELLAEVEAGLPEGLSPGLPRRVLPVAVATLASAKAHAVLLATAEDPSKVIAADALPVSDVVYQAQVLLALAARDGSDPVHPVLFHTVARAAVLCSLATEEANPTLLDAVAAFQRLATKACEELLAQEVLHGPRSVNGVALAFCAATLALPPNPDPKYVDAALRSSARAQQESGLWADGRRLAGHRDPETGDETVMSSHEVALAVAEALSWKLVAIPDAQASEDVAVALRRAVQHASATLVAAPDGHAGWSAEPSYGRSVVEAHPTATVLRLVVITRRVAEAESAARALTGFDLVWNPSRDPVAPYLNWDQYVHDNEPDSANPILPSLDEWFVRPIREHHRVDRRPWSPARGRSLLLFGPPGTTKTTIVKAMAQGLGWPLVTLSPGTFIRDGLEHVERRAIHVFRLLEQLSGVVVLFDECDELFRSREHTAQNDNDQIRSISAFMTASMLPKLQDLRDRERIVFVIATNYFDQIDSAVKRIGRIDHIVGVGWPDERQRRHMITTRVMASEEFSALPEAIRTSAIETLTTSTRHCIRGDIVQLASKLSQRAGELGDERNVEPLVESLTATATKVPQRYREAFRRDAGESSETHKPNRGELV